VVVVAGVQMGRAVISHQFSRLVSRIGIQNISALSPSAATLHAKNTQETGSDPRVNKTKG